ncbi:UDP-N-acetylmuramoyl-L-alanyl-D-glutamate--2,6-diaminopimelate ligase [Corynebacterium gerontici]|uniref:UDP-N-acetylmuramoyl-L-alanyl-D-glutamate--2,6-diaminopimelate ligase n=1 Tax=Corynebacterium gerontici TaxID=2079234 RepID=A0A3G6J1C6_9CORY|nr:UDP-N-acetylmuramoyl-L-alanyl-D-glutamate--2,6-diaminopimelate ligase [Corynebacterium gerontici]AZA11772.1 UDP-N-acetylmuramoyl-L-alanyl-D-glutamate--2,6-diaminopimelate ligase [Corynebacterium gerontici]
MRVKEVAEIAGGAVFGDADVQFQGIGLDSQELPQGAVFAALPGTRSHGAKYAADTNAAAILTDREGHEILQQNGDQRPVIVVDDIRAILGAVSSVMYGEPSKSLTIVGITGTSGKTTTSYLLEAGLMHAGLSVGLIGTTGTRINGRKIPTQLTTPEAPKLQQLFALMVEEGVTHVVMEVSSHALSLGRVGGVDFDVAGFTNLTQDHLDFHPTMQDYFDTKAKLFAAESALSAPKSVICIDDAWGEAMLDIARFPKSLSTNANKHADYVVSQVEVRAAGTQHFSLIHEGQSISVDLNMPGAFNVTNASLALALAAEIGVDPEAVAKGIAGVGVPGRMERVDAGQEFVAVVDYAHKPAAVAAVLDTIRAQVPGRVGVVLGAGGNRDVSKRPVMGAEAIKRADLLIVSDDNPRDEDPAQIRSAIIEGAQQALSAQPSAEAMPKVIEIGDRAEAIARAVQWAEPGDAIVIAGKGHEVGQLVAGVQHHFDDREALREAIELRLEKQEGRQ